MEKEEIRKNILSFRDLAKRWGYTTVRGARRRGQYDRKFPKPFMVLKNETMLFWLPDIEEYEKLRGGIDVSNSRYTFFETKEEWHSKTIEEKEKQRCCKYSSREWDEIKQK